jgi:TRAP-type transport system small permease protein
VLARNWLMISVGWTDEVALMCFVWSVFLGAAVAVRRRAHYVDRHPARELRQRDQRLRLFGALACLPVIYVLLVHGYTFSDMGWRRFSVSLQLPLAYIFAAIPISAVAMILFLDRGHPRRHPAASLGRASPAPDRGFLSRCPPSSP